MKNQQSGFTLIELVAVIVILSILAVTALPKFADLSGAAKQASTDAVAGNLASAMALNYGSALATASGVSGLTHVTVDDLTDCLTPALLLLVGGIPNGYTITPATAGGATNPIGNSAVACTVTYAPGATAGAGGTASAIVATYNAIGTGP